MSAPWIIAFTALWLIVLLMAVVVLGVLRRISGTLEMAEERLAGDVHDAFALGGLPVAARAREFRAFTTNGASHDPREVASAELIRAPTILLFMERDCAPCEALMRDLEHSVDVIEGVPIVVVLDEDGGRPSWLPASVQTVYERSQEVSHAFQNIATPQAYLVDPSLHVLAKRVVRSISDLREMMNQSQVAVG